MKATLGNPVQNGKNLGEIKETIRALSVVVVSGQHSGEVPLTCRWYMGRSPNASLVYCSLWAGPRHFKIPGGKISTNHSGHGQASGHGYCKKSAAFAHAIKTANIHLSEPVDGRGMSPVFEACRAIVRGLGIRGRLVVVE